MGRESRGLLSRSAVLRGACAVLCLAVIAGASPPPQREPPPPVQVAGAGQHSERQAPAQAARRSAQAAMSNHFVPNVGQYGGAVAFAATGPVEGAFVTTRGDLVQLFHRRASRIAPAVREEAWTIQERFAKGPPPSPVALDADGSSITHVSRNGSRSAVGFGRIRLPGIAPGIDLDLRMANGRVERLFVLAPHARAADIDVSTRGADRIEPHADGSLAFVRGADSALLGVPKAFQWVNGERREVAVRYRTRGTHYGFELGTYDADATVFIDPVMQSTYYGGGYIDFGTSVAVDAGSGDVYIAGGTQSSDIVALVGGAMQGHFFYAGFVARFSADLTHLYQATYVDGITGYAYELALNQTSGDVYVGGSTGDTLIPKIEGGANTAPAGQLDTMGYGYIMRLNHGLTELIQSTYFSGVVSGLSVNQASGDVYAAGTGASDPFPAGTPSAFPTVIGTSPASVARLNAQLTHFLGYTYFGGSGVVRPLRLALDQNSGRVFIFGTTGTQDLPGTAGAAQPQRDPNSGDAFVAAFSPDLGTLVRTTYLGGSGEESDSLSFDGGEVYTHAIAVSPQGEPYVTGETVSTDFPGTRNGAVASAPGQIEGYVAHLNSDLSRVLGASYVGGSGDDSPTSIAIAPDTGDVYVGGFTESGDMAGAAGAAISPMNQCRFVCSFAARFDSTLSTLKQSTYYGVEDKTEGYALALDANAASVYLVGLTDNMFLPNSDGAAIPQTLDTNSTAGIYDAYIARFNIALSAAAVHDTPDDFAFNAQSGAPAGASQNSNIVQMHGIDGLVRVHVSGGSYSVDGSPFTSNDGTIGLRQHLQLRLAAPPAPASAAAMTAKVGTVVRRFTVSTTSGSDAMPDAFSFPDKDGVPINSAVTSAPALIQGLDTEATIAVTDGQYSIDGAPPTSDTGLVHSGQTVTVSHTAAVDFSTPQHSTLTIGGVSAVFTSVTEAKDVDPDPLNFGAQLNQQPGTTIQSGPVRVTGINAPAPVIIENGRYAILEQGDDYTNSPGTILQGQHITVAMLAPAAFSSTGQTTLHIGNTTGVFVVTTAPEDATPDPISFNDISNGELDTLYMSQGSIAGFNTTIPVSISGGEYAFAQDGPYTSAPGHIAPGQILFVRVRSASTYNTLTQATLTAGATSGVFRVTTKAQQSSSSSSSGGSGSSSSSSSSGGGQGGGGGGATGLDFLALMSVFALTAMRRRRT